MRSPRHAKLNVQDGKQKYEFKEITSSFRCASAPLLPLHSRARLTSNLCARSNTSATFSLHYQVQPYVGALTGGEVVRTEPVAFPPVRTRSQ